MFNKIIKGAIGTVAVRITGTALQFFLAFTLTRLGGANVAGEFYTFQSWVFLGSVLAGFGIPTFLLKWSKRWIINGETHKLAEWVKFSFLLGIVILATLTAITPYILPQKSLSDFKQSHMALSAGISMFFIIKTLSELLKGIDKPKTGLLLEYGTPPFMTIGILIAKSNWGASHISSADAITAYLMATAVTLTIAIYLIYKVGILSSSNSITNGISTIVETFKVYIKEITILWAINTLTTLTATLPYIILPFMATSDFIGKFAIAHKLVSLFATIRTALHGHFAGKVSIVIKQGNIDAIITLYNQSRITLALFFVPLAMLYISFSKEILLLFGPDFPEAREILICLVIGRLIGGVLGLPELFLIMHKTYTFELFALTITTAFFGILSIFSIVVHTYWLIILAYSLMFPIKDFIGFFLVRRSLFKRRGWHS